MFAVVRRLSSAHQVLPLGQVDPPTARHCDSRRRNRPRRLHLPSARRPTSCLAPCRWLLRCLGPSSWCLRQPHLLRQVAAFTSSVARRCCPLLAPAKQQCAAHRRTPPHACPAASHRHPHVLAHAVGSAAPRTAAAGVRQQLAVSMMLQMGGQRRKVGTVATHDCIDVSFLSEAG